MMLEKSTSRGRTKNFRMVIGLCSRITEIINGSNEEITLEARWADSKPVAVNVQNLHKSVTIGPREHKDVFFGDFHNEANRYRDMVRWFRVGHVTKTIQAGEIRDYAKIRVNYDGTAITYNRVEGNMIGRIGIFLAMKRATKKIKSFVRRNNAQG